MWIQISSGRGPDECELAVGLFLKRLLTEHKNAKVTDAEPGRYAGWIAPPRVGIDGKPGDFAYVRLAEA